MASSDSQIHKPQVCKALILKELPEEIPDILEEHHGPAHNLVLRLLTYISRKTMKSKNIKSRF